MIQFSDRDKKIIAAMIKRGWVSTRFLDQFFPSRKSTNMRIIKLRSEKVIESKSARELLAVDKYVRSSFPVGYNVEKLYFHRLTEDCINSLDATAALMVSDKIVVHQLYQEYIELELMNKYGVTGIEPNPSKKPRPDLFFEFNDRRFSIEIERNIKTNLNDWFQKKKNKKTGEIIEKKRLGFDYQKRVDALLKFSDVVIYYVPNEKFIKLMDRRVSDNCAYLGTLDNPHELYNKNLKIVTLESVLNGR